MKRTKRTGRKTRVLVSFIIVTLVAFFFVKMVQLQVQLDEKQGQLDSLFEQITMVQIQNEDLQAKNDSLETEEGQKQQLRENGYVADDDQVYIYAGN